MTAIICLATQSRSRQEILEGVHFKFDMRPANIDESLQDETVDEYVLRLSKEKAEAVLDGNHAKIIVGADSVAEIDGEILGKPNSKDEAIQILSKLSGKWHTFVTGLTVIRVSDNTIIQKLVKTRVKLANLSNVDLELYVNQIQPFRYAGGFSNTESSWFIEKIEGSISNLMGLPMFELYTILTELGITLYDLY